VTQNSGKVVSDAEALRGSNRTRVDAPSGARRPAPVIIRIPDLANRQSSESAASRPVHSYTALPDATQRTQRDGNSAAVSSIYDDIEPSLASHWSRRLDSPGVGERRDWGGGEDESLPEPQRRVSSREHSLRRVRRELQTVAGHSVRNTIVLLLILLAAASLTVWITQGIEMQGRSPGPSPTTKASSRPDKSPANVDWTFPTSEAPYSSDLDTWTAGRPGALQGASSAPTVDAWPPSRPESQSVPAAPADGGPVWMTQPGAGTAHPTNPDPQYGGIPVDSPTRMSGQAETQQAPVASLRGIQEVQEVRR
jgi:hypothetical protein